MGWLRTMLGGTRNSVGNNIGLNNTTMIAHRQPTMIMDVGEQIIIVSVVHTVLMQSRPTPTMDLTMAKSSESRENKHVIANKGDLHRLERNIHADMEPNVKIRSWMVI